jgi:peptidoglycan/LPS O-acetylase OafA/YrhL/glycosyltransferase involved in cell wall biosynthesis
MSADRPENTKAVLPGIEALRAIASLCVVAYHSAAIIAAQPGGSPPPLLLQNGAAGVDIFFVISGFVMVLSARSLAGRVDAARRFVRARLRRIVPLYWLCTGIKIAAMLAAPGLARGALTPGICIASLLFLPVHDAAGRFKPVLAVGWTLSFEMMFYALFAASLAARRAPVLWVPPVLAGIALLPHTGAAASELANPIILEFAFGTTLAALWLRGWRLPAALAWPVLLVAAALLIGTPKLALGTRVLSWGLPAAMLVAATVSLDRRPGAAIPRVWLELGAASYAIYLTHGFVLDGLGLMLARLPIHALPAAAVLAVAMPGCAAAGWLVHALIETRLLGARRAGADGAAPPVVLVLAGGGLSPLSGGVGTLMRNLMESWADNGSAPRIRLLDSRGQGGAATGMLRFAGSLWLTAWLCASGQVHLVHAHMTTRGSAARKTLLCGLAMIIGVPVIVHMHGVDFMPFHRGLHPALRWPLDAMLRRARHVVVLGVRWRRFLVQEAGIDPARISIVPNGVPRSVARVVAPTDPMGDAPAQILFLGRLCARKGLPELISALAVPALREKAWRATFAGDGNAAPFRAMLAWHGLQTRIALPGWAGRAETQALLAQADILILPSHHEALPLAVLEALAAGVAVITTPVGVIPEFLEHGTHALLVPPGQPAALAAAILRLLDDAGLRARLARAGHAVFRERLEISGIAARIADLYRDAVAGKAAAQAAGPGGRVTIRA